MSRSDSEASPGVRQFRRKPRARSRWAGVRASALIARRRSEPDDSDDSADLLQAGDGHPKVPVPAAAAAVAAVASKATSRWGGIRASAALLARKMALKTSTVGASSPTMSMIGAEKSERKASGGWGALRTAVRQDKGMYRVDSDDVLKAAKRSETESRGASLRHMGSRSFGSRSANSFGSKAAFTASAHRLLSRRPSALKNRVDDLKMLVLDAEKVGIDPESPKVASWRVVVTAAILIQLVLVPYRWAFVSSPTPDTALDVVMFAADVVFVIDVFVKTRLGFIHNGNKIVNRDIIWVHYVFSWEFPLDIVAALPWEFVAVAAGAQLSFARIPKLLRAAYIPTRMKELEGAAGLSTTGVRFIKTFVYVLLASHFVGCLWFLVGKTSGIGETPFSPPAWLSTEGTSTKYLHSLYFGHGMLMGMIEIAPPSNTLENIFAQSTMFVGVFVVAYLIAAVNGLLSEGDLNKLKFRSILNKVNHFMSYHKLPRELHERIINYQRFMFAEYGGFDENAILSVLPAILKADTATFLARGIVTHVAVLRGAEDGFIASLVTMLKPWLVSHGEFVVTRGDVATEIYFVNWGEIEEEVEVESAMHKGTELLVVRVLGQTDSLGSYELLHNEKFMYSYRAKAFSHLYALTKSVLERLFEHYPDTYRAITINSEKVRRNVNRSEARAIGRVSTELGVEFRRSTRSADAGAKISTKSDGKKRRRRASVVTASRLGKAEWNRAAGAVRNGASRTRRAALSQTAAERLAARTTLSMLFFCPCYGRLKKRVRQSCCRSSRVVHYSSRTATLLEEIEFPISVIHPDSIFRRRWLWVVMVSYLYNFIAVPLRIAFSPTVAHPVVYVLDYVTDVIFLFDMWFRARLAVHHRGMLLVDSYALISRYVFSYSFVGDLLASLPLDLMGLGTGPHAIWRVNKLIRGFHLESWFEEANKRSYRYGLLRLVKMSFLLLSVMHIIACLYWCFTFWEGFATDPDELFLPMAALADEPITTQYARALYYTLKPRGFGRDLGPTSDAATLFSLLTMMVGVYVYAFLIGNIGALLSSLDVNAAEFRRRKNLVERFMETRNIPRSLQTRIHSFFEVWWASHEGVEPNDVVQDLPPALQTQVMYALCAENVRRVPFFADCNTEFVTALCKRLTMEVVPPGEQIVRKDDIGDSMYFVSTGAVDIMQEGLATDINTYKTIGPGSFFGEGAFFHGRRSATVRARTACELFVLTHDALEAVIAPYPSLVVRLELLANRRRAKLNRQRDNVRSFAKVIKGLRRKSRRAAPVTGKSPARGKKTKHERNKAMGKAPVIATVEDDEAIESGAEETKAEPSPAESEKRGEHASVFGLIVAKMKLGQAVRRRRERKKEIARKQVNSTISTIQAMMAIRRAVKRRKALKEQQEREAQDLAEDAEEQSAEAGMKVGALFGVTRAVGKFKARRAKYMPTDNEIAQVLADTRQDDDDEMAEVDQLLESPFALGAKDLLDLVTAERKIAREDEFASVRVIDTDAPLGLDVDDLAATALARRRGGRSFSLSSPEKSAGSGTDKAKPFGTSTLGDDGTPSDGTGGSGSAVEKQSALLARRHGGGTHQEPTTAAAHPRELRKHPEDAARDYTPTASGGAGGPTVPEANTPAAREMHDGEREASVATMSPASSGATGEDSTLISQPTGKSSSITDVAQPGDSVVADEMGRGRPSGASERKADRFRAGEVGALHGGDDSKQSPQINPANSFMLGSVDLRKEFSSHLNLLELAELAEASGGGGPVHLAPLPHSALERVHSSVGAHPSLLSNTQDSYNAANANLVDTELRRLQEHELQSQLPSAPERRRMLEDAEETVVLARMMGLDDGGSLSEALDGAPAPKRTHSLDDLAALLEDD